ncbi:hypothetical protein U1Q18_021560 [Sarracenia purpurea var. burkii]
MEGKIIQTRLRIGSSLVEVGCSGARADRDLECRPEETLKSIQDQKGPSNVADDAHTNICCVMGFGALRKSAAATLGAGISM